MATLFLYYRSPYANFTRPWQNLLRIGTIGLGVSLSSLLWFYWSDWDWRNDLYIVRDDTIVMIHKRPLWLQNNRDQILLNQIDNVVAESKGFFQQAFSYGDVRISLIGADRFKVFG